jgi:hypothetical protein
VAFLGLDSYKNLLDGFFFLDVGSLFWFFPVIGFYFIDLLINQLLKQNYFSNSKKTRAEILFFYSAVITACASKEPTIAHVNLRALYRSAQLSSVFKRNFLPFILPSLNLAHGYDYPIFFPSFILSNPPNANH